MEQWEIDGINQAIIESKKRIKRPHDYWWRMHDQLTGSADYVYGMDEGEEKRHHGVELPADHDPNGIY